MTNQYVFEEYTGFTKEEVMVLCAQYDMDFAKAGSWYDGYRLKQFKHIYNPKSVVEERVLKQSVRCHEHAHDLLPAACAHSVLKLFNNFFIFCRFPIRESRRLW